MWKYRSEEITGNFPADVDLLLHPELQKFNHHRQLWVKQVLWQSY